MFDKEEKHFEAHRDEWLANGRADQWVAIRGDQRIGFWKTLAEAVDAIQLQFGDKLIFIRQVTAADIVPVIQRLGR
jgi:hypothetical protein